MARDSNRPGNRVVRADERKQIGDVSDPVQYNRNEKPDKDRPMTGKSERMYLDRNVWRMNDLYERGSI